MAEAKSARGRIPLNGRIMLIVVPPKNHLSDNYTTGESGLSRESRPEVR